MMKEKFGIILVVLQVIYISCKQEEGTHYELLPRLSIDIPDELNEEPELIQFIRGSEESINYLTQTVEKICSDNDKILSKKADKMSMGERIRLISVKGQLNMCFEDFSVKYSEIQSQIEQYKSGMSPEESGAISTVSEIFEKRMKQLEEIIKNIQLVS